MLRPFEETVILAKLRLLFSFKVKKERKFVNEMRIKAIMKIFRILEGNYKVLII